MIVMMSITWRIDSCSIPGDEGWWRGGGRQGGCWKGFLELDVHNFFENCFKFPRFEIQKSFELNLKFFEFFPKISNFWIYFRYQSIAISRAILLQPRPTAND